MGQKVVYTKGVSFEIEDVFNFYMENKSMNLNKILKVGLVLVISASGYCSSFATTTTGASVDSSTGVSTPASATPNDMNNSNLNGSTGVDNSTGVNSSAVPSAPAGVGSTGTVVNPDSSVGSGK
jgi:hypothetical protein